MHITITGSNTLYISSYYRPDEHDEISQQQFRLSLSRLPSNTTLHVWIVEDKNFPGMDWENNNILNTCRTPNLHLEYLECLEDHGLQQLVTTPTREKNILDLFLTNNPTRIESIKVIPGISDHEAVLVEGCITPATNKQR